MDQHCSICFLFLFSLELSEYAIGDGCQGDEVYFVVHLHRFFYTGMEIRAEKIEVRQAEETMAIIVTIIRMPFSFFGSEGKGRMNLRLPLGRSIYSAMFIILSIKVNKERIHNVLMNDTLSWFQQYYLY